MKSSKEDQKAALLENREANERIHNLVIKIISWRSGILDGAIIDHSNKITRTEWSKYQKHIITISKTDSAEKVKGKLKETKEAIQAHGGFDH